MVDTVFTYTQGRNKDIRGRVKEEIGGGLKNTVYDECVSNYRVSCTKQVLTIRSLMYRNILFGTVQRLITEKLPLLLRPSNFLNQTRKQRRYQFLINKMT